MTMLDYEVARVSYTTSGPWLDEPSTATALDGVLDGCDRLFKVYREVTGYPAHPRTGAEMKTKLRIDRLLVPKQPLIDAGWCHGIVGIECKMPGTKIGPVVCQCMDYGRTVWELPHGFWIMAPWTFIWQLDEFAGDIASVMTQNRIGGASSNRYEPLVFKHAGGSMLRVKADGKIEVTPAKCGMKAGSR